MQLTLFAERVFFQLSPIRSEATYEKVFHANS